jgi:hypothetical protein
MLFQCSSNSPIPCRLLGRVTCAHRTKGKVLCLRGGLMCSSEGEYAEHVGRRNDRGGHQDELGHLHIDLWYADCLIHQTAHLERHSTVVRHDVAGGDVVQQGELLDVLRASVKFVSRPVVGSEVLMHGIYRPPVAVTMGAGTRVPDAIRTAHSVL